MLNRLFRVIDRFFKIIIIGVIIIGVLYLGSCVYANFIQSDPGEYKLPSTDQAKYEITIKNTGNVIYVDGYDIDGTKYLLSGYWELVDNKYIFVNDKITLDQAVFGKITVWRR